MWLRRRGTGKPSEDQVVIEAQLLLEGRVSDGGQNGRRKDPAWVAINALAHSGIVELRRLSGQASPGHPASWAATVAYLAVETLAAGPTDGELLRVQREVLVPLELRLLLDRRGGLATPGQFAAVVTAALKEHDARHNTRARHRFQGG